MVERLLAVDRSVSEPSNESFPLRFDRSMRRVSTKTG